MSEADNSSFDNLPSDWNISPLDKLCIKSFGGGTPSTKNTSFWDGDIPWTTTAIINKDDIYLNSYQRKITQEGLNNSSSHVAPKGCVLVGTRVGVGKAVVPLFDIAINQDITALVPDGTITSEFLAYSLKQPKFQKWFSDNKRGTTIKGVTRQDLTKLEIPLPPLPEQKAIAHVLKTVQTAKEVTEKVIAATKELKKSLMKHLFTYGATQPSTISLVESEIGLVPESWLIKPFKDVATKPQYGFTATANIKPVGPKCLRITDIQNDAVDWETVPYCECDEKLIHKYKLKRDDIVIARIGATTGKTYLVTQDNNSIFASYLIRIRGKSEIDSEYLYQFTKSEIYWKQINATKGGRLKQGVNIPTLESLLIPVPPLHEQERIKSILNASDNHIISFTKKLQALEILFNSLLHNLMTGKVRVNELKGVN